MVGILIATHGKFAAGLLDSAELIIGKQAQCMTLGLCHGDDIDFFGAAIKDAVVALDEGDGVLVLTDLFSASPYNQAALNYPQLKGHVYRSVCGVNLPMLLEAIGKRMCGEDLAHITDAAIEAGKSGIKELFREMAKQKIEKIKGDDENGRDRIGTD